MLFDYARSWGSGPKYQEVERQSGNGRNRVVWSRGTQFAKSSFQRKFTEQNVMTLDTLLKQLPPDALTNVNGASADAEIKSLACDSRQVTPGTLGFAVPGDRTGRFCD